MSGGAKRREKKDPGEGRVSSLTPFAVGRALFLAAIFFTPIMIGIIPPAISMFDPIGLPKVVVMTVLSGLSLCAWAVGVLRGDTEVHWRPLLWLVVALAGWAVVSTLFAPAPAVSVLGHVNHWQGLMSYVSSALLVFLALQFIRRADDVRAVMVASVAAGCIVATYAIAQYLGFDPIAWTDPIARVTSSHGNADMLGNYLVFPLSLSIGLAIAGSARIQRWVLWSAVGLLSAALLASSTIGAWIGAIAMLAVFAYLYWHDVWHASRGRVLAGVTALVGAFALMVPLAAFLRPDIRGRLATASWPMLARITNGRSILWATGLRAWLVHPVVGWGPDQFAQAFQFAARADWYAINPDLKIAIVAHSMLVQQLVTLGLPGLVLLLWALGLAFVVGLRWLHGTTYQTPPALRIAPIGALLGMSVALSLGVSATIISFWLWLAVAFVVAPTSRRADIPAKLRWVGYPVAIAGLVLATWASTWAVADVYAAVAFTAHPGAEQVALWRAACAWNPLQPTYRFQQAMAEYDALTRAPRSPAGAAQLRADTLGALASFEAASHANPRDPHVLIAEAQAANFFAFQNKDAELAGIALAASSKAVELAPYNPKALAELAKAANLMGEKLKAFEAAKLAHEVAPAYAMQTLGSFGLGNPPSQ